MDNTNATLDIYRLVAGAVPLVDDDNDPQTPPVVVLPDNVYQDEYGAIVYVWPDYEDEDFVAPDPDTEDSTYPLNTKVANDVPAMVEFDRPSLTTGLQMGDEVEYRKFARIRVGLDVDVRPLDYITHIKFDWYQGMVNEDYWVRDVTPIIGPLGTPIGLEIYGQYVEHPDG